MADKYSIQYQLDNLTAQQFTILLSEAANALQWRMATESDDVVFITPRSDFGPGEKVTVHTEGGIAFISSKHTQWQLGGKKWNERNLTDLTHKLDTLRGQYTPEMLDAMYTNAVAENEAYAKELEERIQSGTLTATEKISLGMGGHYVTYTLIAINLLVFIAMAISGAGLFEFNIDALDTWGGNIRSLTVNGEWWRLFTCMFLHGGIIHVAFNMYALFYVGLYLEPLLGRWRYLAVYLATGIFASLTSIAMHANVVSVGASGAIFGLYGVFLALLTTNLVDKGMRKPMLTSIAIFVVYNLAYGVKSGVDNAAHAGGLVSGAVFGYLYYLLFKNKKSSLAFGLIVLAVAAAGAYVALPTIGKLPGSDQAKFAKSVNRIMELQNQALQPYKEVKSDSIFSNDDIEKFKTITLPAWQQCMEALDSADNYKLTPEALTYKNNLKKYIDLRLQQVQLFIQNEKQQTITYSRQIDENQAEIDKVLNALNDKKK